MSYYTSRRSHAQLGLMLLTVLLLVQPRATAQAGSQWYFENVSEGNLIPGCVTGMTLAGFEFDPQGRPALGWREENGCGGPPRVFWTRFDAGTWDRKEFLSERRFQGGGAADHSHQFSLRKSDGNPFFVYADAGQFNEINTYRSDVGLHPNGGVSTYLENIVGPQNCDYTNYGVAFGPNDPVPQWVTGFATCNGQGSLRLNATDIQSPLFSPRGALEITPDGTRHVLWNTGSYVNYSRFPFGATVADHHHNLFETINRFGGEVKIAQGPDGVLHAIVRGPDVTADWDLGAIVYLRSDDGGTSWSPYEYVDSHDDPSVQEPWNANSDVSLAVDPQGVPAVAFWRWNSELWYAKRDGPNGTWTQQLITALPLQNQARANQVRFDANGDPIVAFYDAAINEMRLARPVPAGVVMPVDVSVVSTVAPGTANPGAAATYTLTVTNQGVTNLDQVTLSNRLPAGALLTGVNPPAGLGGRWEFPLTSGASRTFTINAQLPFAEGAHAAVAEVAANAMDADPADNMAMAVATIKAEMCFVPHAEGDGLLGWFRGDGAAVNSVPNRAPGGARDISYVDAAVGQGFSFNGTSSSIRINEGDDNYYYPREGSFTAQAYIRTSSTGGYIASRYECLNGACAPGAWFWGVESGHLSLYLRDRFGNDMNLQGVRRVDDGEFHHVAMVIDRSAGEARLIVDGLVDVAAPLGVNDIAEGNGRTTSLMLGSYSDLNDNPAGFFSGVIDEFAIYNRVLSAAELDEVTGVPHQEACRTQIGAVDDLSVAMVATPAEATPGDFVTMTVAVTNRGPVPRPSVQVSTNVTEVTLIDSAPLPVSTIDQVQRFDLGSLAPGQTKWAVVRAMAPMGTGSFLATAHIDNNSDANPLNDHVSVNVSVRPDVCFVVGSDLAARWRLDGDASDSIGGRNGQLHGTTAFALGKKNNALAIGAPSGWAEVPDALELEPNTFTIAGWFNAETLSGWNTVVAKGASGADPNLPWFADTYWLGLAWNGYPTLYTHHPSAGTIETIAANPVASNRWYHLAATYDGSVARVFLDGVQVAESTINEPLVYDSEAVPLTIGEDWQGGSAWGAPFVGLLEDVTLHARALSAEDVAAMVTGSSSECVNDPPISVDDVIRNGEIETRSDYDAVGAIVSPGGSCSATLLSRTVALTAAQCVFNVPPQDLQFRISADLSAAVTTVLVHPQFVGDEGANLAFDVALVRLDAAAVATWPAIDYPAVAEHEMQTGTIGLAVGAASISGSWMRASGSLLVTQYLGGEGPAGNFFDNGFIETLPATAANHMFCARGHGGPLFDAGGRMTGVASFRFVETCAETGPGYYVNLYRLRNWITTSASAVDDVIRNGDIETRSQYDAVGAIESPGGSCSATLLSGTVALTAAQCVYNVPLQDLQFRISADLSAAVTAALIHPGFVGDDGINLAFDVALVKLDAAAVATWPGIGYPAIAENEMTAGATGLAAGAASIGGNWVRASGSLMVTQYLAGEGPIGTFFADGFIETLPATAANHMFCARGHGGPLFDADGRMAGVASFRFVETCAEAGPGYYVNLERLREWITTSAHTLEVNDPPTLDPIADATVVAGQLLVVRLENMTPGPADEVSQELEVIVSSSDPAVTGISFYQGGQLTFGPPFRPDTRSATVTVTVREVLEPASAVTQTFNVTVLGGGNTPPGSDVSVVSGPISVTFSQVIAGGETSYIQHAADMAPPSGFAFGNPPVWYDISTTAQYVAPIVVCITYGPDQFADPTAARLFHFESGTWVDRTISVDVATRTVCGSAGSLSPFGLFEPAAPPAPELEGRMHGQAGFTIAGVDYDVHFRIAERKIGRERGTLNLKMTMPKIGTTKKRTDRFESTRIDDIVFSNDPAFTSGRSTSAPPVDTAAFSGVGKWNGAAGYRFEATATDQGEPGRGRDRFAITIYDASGAPVATADAVIASGNIQSDRLRPEHWR